MSAPSRVRVLRIIARLNIGGPAIHVGVLAAGLPASRYEQLTVHGAIGPGEGDMADLLADRPRLVVPALGRAVRPWHDAVAFAALVRLLFRFRPDIVHTHTAKAGALGRLATVIYRACHPGRGLRTVHTFHGHVFSGYFSPAVSRLVVWTERQLARLTDRIVVLGPAQAREITETFRVARTPQVRVISLGLPLDAVTRVTHGPSAPFRKELGAAPGVPVVTIVGRLVPVKNHGLLLAAFARLMTLGPRPLLAVIGDGELRGDLQRQARALGIADAVRFLGWRRDLDVVYGGSDVVVLCSHNEGTPVSLIEAMAAGCPVVATAVGGVPDLVAHQRTGWLVPAGDAEGLAAALATLIGDRDLRERLAATAHAEVTARYDARRLVDDIDGLYSELIQSRG